jgi:hypothetical protein
MTTLTMRMIKGDFVVTGPDVEPVKFKPRREATSAAPGAGCGQRDHLHGTLSSAR